MFSKSNINGVLWIPRELSGTMEAYGCHHFCLCQTMTLTKMVVKSHGICFLRDVIANDGGQGTWLLPSVLMRSEAKMAANLTVAF